MLLLNEGRGSGEVARQHVRYLVREGHEVSFLHPRMGAGIEGADNRDIALHSEIVPVHEHLPSAAANQKAVSQMAYEEAVAYLPDYESALEEIAGEVDLFVGHHGNLSAVATAEVAQRHSKPYVLFLHGTGIEPRLHGKYDDRVWALIERAIRGANGILVTTEYVRDELVRPLVDLPDERFLILPCGVDTEEFDPVKEAGTAHRLRVESPFVICPGALTHVKGPQNVVRASQEYADLAQTIFIGGGELRAELEAELGDRGRFLGFVPAEDKAALITEAAILTAAPEKKEHFGIVYVEALSAGTPSVAYEGGGVSTIVTPETGVLTAREPAALGRAIRELLESPERRRAMSLAGRERALELFSWTSLGRRLEEWLLGLIG
jgi:glycosyltransferase involved in cell wall biosynthesis